VSDEPEQPPRKATKGEVRTVGGFFLVGGLILIFVVPANMTLQGALPVWCAGIAVVALGLSMLLFPSAAFFARRVARITEIGERFTGKKTGNEPGRRLAAMEAFSPDPNSGDLRCVDGETAAEVA